MATTKGYATSSQLAQIIGIKVDVPSWEVGKTPENESVGQGDSSTTLFYLNHKNILDSSYTLFYGDDNTTTDELIDTTDYSIESDTGIITLTDDGVTKLVAKKIFAKYSYTKNGMENDYLVDILNRAEIQVDNSVNSVFTDGTATNPTYPSETEIQPSPGYFNNKIIVKKKPLIDVSTTLSGALTSSATTISLDAGTGSDYPSSGNIIINSEVISYTGVSTDSLTGCSRGTFGTTSGAHSHGDAIHSTALFLSNTSEGTDVTYTVQPWDSEMYATGEGLISTFADSVFASSYYPDKLSMPGVANRTKIIYYYGYDTIPVDITRLSLLFAKRQLITDNIGKSMIAGRNEFRPEMLNADEEEIRRIMDSYIVLPMANT